MSFFDSRRSKLADQDLQYCFQCAEEAGIRDKLFLGFGGLLGAIREGSYIGHDNDLDLCLKADQITQQQEMHYYNLLARDEKYPFCPKNPWKDIAAIPVVGMFTKRRKYSRRSDNGRLTWFSLRKREGHAKFCHWLGFDWNGYWWHSKGGKWVKDSKFSRSRFGYDQHDDALMKGIPSLFVEKIIEVEFRGFKINIPRMYGSCLDFWYPGWKIPRKGGASAKTVIGIVKDWSDKDTWRVKIA